MCCYLRTAVHRLVVFQVFQIAYISSHIFDHLRLVKQRTSAAAFPFLKALLFQLSAHVKVQLYGGVFFFTRQTFFWLVQSSLCNLNHGQVQIPCNAYHAMLVGSWWQWQRNDVTEASGISLDEFRVLQGQDHIIVEVCPGSLVNLSAMMCYEYDSIWWSIAIYSYHILMIFSWYYYHIQHLSLYFLLSGRVYSDDVGGRGLGRWVPMHARLSCWRIAFSCRTSWLNPKSILINTSRRHQDISSFWTCFFWFCDHLRYFVTFAMLSIRLLTPLFLSCSCRMIF